MDARERVSVIRKFSSSGNTIWVKGVPTLISERHYDIADIA